MRHQAETASCEELSELKEAREKIVQLETALQSRVVIEQAKGILAERLGTDVDTAFGILRHAARSHRLKIHDLAERVVRERSTPMPVVDAIARESRMRASSMREQAEAQRAHLGQQVAEQL